MVVARMDELSSQLAAESDSEATDDEEDSGNDDDNEQTSRGDSPVLREQLSAPIAEVCFLLKETDCDGLPMIDVYSGHCKAKPDAALFCAATRES